MKDLMKRAAALMAAAVMVFSISVTAFAEPTSRPRPGTSSTATQTTQTQTDNEESEVAEETVKTTKAPTETKAPAAAATGKNYTTKGGSFLWFLLSVIVNTAISLAIANRFYKLTKRQNHVQSELRALRRDIEEKFINNVGGFAEPNVDITNTNDDYSMEAEGIVMTPASTVSVDDEQGDVYKQWEAQFGARYSERKNAEAQEEPERRVRKYKPDRDEESRMSVRERIAARRASRAAEVVEETEDDEDFEERGGISEKLSSVGDKAKKLLGGIFPFDEDDEE